MKPPPESISATENNIAVLSHYLQELSTLPLDAYQYTRIPVFPSSIGAHLRHDLDHYLSFFGGLEEGLIDYERRQREPTIEQSPTRGRDVVNDLMKKLDGLSVAPETSLKVRLESNGKPDRITSSTVSRELDFLLSHSIHHQAIISMMLRDQGLQPSPEFGTAPSTIRHQQQSCAQ